MIQMVKAKDGAEQKLLELLRSRSSEADRSVTAAVTEIIERVKEKGDAALLEYAEKFDGVKMEVLEVSGEAIEKALKEAEPDFIRALKNARENITAYHSKQKQRGYRMEKDDGVMMGQKVRGLHRVGLYVPGGKAAYPSSVLMNAIPAKIAEVSEIIMITPPGKDGKPNPDILAAAAVAGVDRIFLTGGAHGVAALALGTESIPKVDKIVGPGNIYVATAKKLLFGAVDIDMIAGPSEILIVADQTANPAYLAADMMSQAEHDPMASSILITTSEEIAEKTRVELEKQVEKLERKDTILEALRNFGAIFICDDLNQAVALADEIAPEHIEIVAENPLDYVDRIQNAGSVFLGNYAPEPLGDYYAGPNHVLPTSGTARFFSPLSVDDFVKKSSYIYYTREALEKAKDDIILIANKEGLTAHANAIAVRFQQE